MALASARSATPSGGGLPSTITVARPDAGRHRLPARCASTLTTHSHDGPMAAARRGSPPAGSSRNACSILPRMAIGVGLSPSCHASSSRRKRSYCASAQAAPHAAIATPSNATAARERPHHDATPHAASDATAAPQHATARFTPGQGSTRRVSPHPAARQAAATTAGRAGSGSSRRWRSSQRSTARGPATRGPHATWIQSRAAVRKASKSFNKSVNTSVTPSGKAGMVVRMCAGTARPIGPYLFDERTSRQGQPRHGQVADAAKPATRYS